MPKAACGGPFGKPSRRFAFAAHPVGGYFVDFACPITKLAIEIDGSRHTLQTDADDRRTVALAKSGYRVIRFWNNEVLQNLNGVIEKIDLELWR